MRRSVLTIRIFITIRFSRRLTHNNPETPLLPVSHFAPAIVNLRALQKAGETHLAAFRTSRFGPTHAFSGSVASEPARQWLQLPGQARSLDVVRKATWNRHVIRSECVRSDGRLATTRWMLLMGRLVEMLKLRTAVTRKFRQIQALSGQSGCTNTKSVQSLL